VVIGLPRLLREIVLETIRSEPDLDVVQDYPDPVDLRDVVRRARPHVVVADADALPLVEVGQVLMDEPDLMLVGLHGDGRQLLLYQLAPHRIALGEASPRRLLDIIRGGFECGNSWQSVSAIRT